MQRVIVEEPVMCHTWRERGITPWRSKPEASPSPRVTPYRGPEQYEPSSLRARAHRVVPCADASTTEEPEAGKLHVRDGTGGAASPACPPWRSRRGRTDDY